MTGLERAYDNINKLVEFCNSKETNTTFGENGKIIHLIKDTVGKATYIYGEYGYEIKRTDSAEDKGVIESTRQIEYKYQFRCEKCGKVIGRTRASRFTRNPEWFTHRCCGKKKKKI